MKNQEKKFELNKTQISNVGFDLTSEKNLVSDFASPFEESVEKAHPLNAVFPEGMTNFNFQYEKISSKLGDDIFIYMFYNVMEEKLQLSAARSLMERGYKYHKEHKVWVRMKDKSFQYFNINEWKHCEFTGSTRQEDYYNKDDFTEK